jgi:hypothetical protein
METGKKITQNTKRRNKRESDRFPSEPPALGRDAGPEGKVRTGGGEEALDARHKWRERDEMNRNSRANEQRERERIT